jgi:hypothetical protein
MDFTKLSIGNSFTEGERSQVRRIRYDDVEEMSRMRTIEDDPGVAEYVRLQATEEELIRLPKVARTIYAWVWWARKGVLHRKK